MGIKAGLHFLESQLPAQTTGGEDWLLVKAQVARLEELFSRYQDFLQPERVVPGAFPANAVVQAAVDLVRYQLRRLGDDFSLTLPPESPLAWGNPSVLSHAVTNLLLNALDALEEVGGRVAVRLSRTPGRGMVTVRVSDDGRGLTQEAAQKLFSTGFTTKPSSKGAGLGLKLASRLLEAHGGTLDLVPFDDPERLPWARTEFLVTLPAADAPGARQAPPAQVQSRPLYALVVDDEPVILKLLGRTLLAEGYQVTTAATGAEAQMLLNSRIFDLLITDKNLPGTSGVALAAAARALSQRTVILLITAFGNAESARTMLALGIDGYLQKPFELDELSMRVKAAAAVRHAPTVASETPREPRRAVWVHQQDPEDARRLSEALSRLGLEAAPLPQAAADLSAPSAAGAVVSTQLLTTPLRESLWAARASRPDFRVVVTMADDSLAECIATMAVGATGELALPLPEPGALAEVLKVALQSPRTR